MNNQKARKQRQQANRQQQANPNIFAFGEYVLHCLGCLRSDIPLAMYPQKNDGKMVGWVMVCAICEKELLAHNERELRAHTTDQEQKGGAS